MSSKVEIGGGLTGYKGIWKQGNRLDRPDDPAVVVLQEWWGVNDEIQQQAQTIADQGYVTLVPDLYRGKVGLDVAEAQHLFDGLDWQQAVKDVQASVEFLRLHNPSRKVGVIGFCMGGALALLTASAKSAPQQFLNCAVTFYGLPSAEVCGPLVQQGVPIQGHFGLRDTHKGFSDPDTARDFEKRLAEQGSCHEPFHFYEGQGHGFMNTTAWYEKPRVQLGRPPKDPAVITSAWTSVFSFFDEHLH